MPPTPRPHGKKTNVKVPSVGDSGNRRLLVILGGAGIFVLAVVVGFVVFGGGSSDGGSKDATQLLTAAGCTIQTVNALPGEHTVLTPSGTSPKWNTSPPTNGPHYQIPALWGAYTTPLYPAQFVHNLEHGGIYIMYGKGVPRTTIDELKAFYDTHQNGTLLAPLPSLGSKIALGVWNSKSETQPKIGTARLVKCTTFDQKAYAAFFSAFQFKGPERFPASTLTPGS